MRAHDAGLGVGRCDGDSGGTDAQNAFCCIFVLRSDIPRRGLHPSVPVWWFPGMLRRGLRTWMAKGELVGVQALSACREHGKGNLEGVCKSSHRSPRGILAPALKVRDPCRVEGGAVSDLFLAQPSLKAQLSQRGAQAFLRFGSSGHRRDRRDNICRAP